MKTNVRGVHAPYLGEILDLPLVSDPIWLKVSWLLQFPLTWDRTNSDYKSELTGRNPGSATGEWSNLTKSMLSIVIPINMG